MLKLVWERWKKVPELENIKVSSLGCVKINGKLIRPKVNNKGYFVVTHENKHYFVHRLVAKTFLKHNLEKYDTIDHIDQNKRNNALSNLEIVSHEENIKRAVENFISPNCGITEMQNLTAEMPNWTVRLSDGKYEYKSVAKACNALMNETNLTRDEAIRDIYAVLIFGVKGKRPWKFVKEKK